MEILKSRKTFIKQVAKTIRKNHAQHEESFIFGISGKWGEGKTVFLDGLTKELSDFYIIKDLNPWKFASEKTSFLREFISQFQQLKTVPTFKTKLIQLRGFINNDNRKDSLYSDISTNQIHPGWAIFLTLAYLFLIIVLINFSSQIQGLSSQLKWVVTFSAIPFLIAFIGKMIVSEKTQHSVKTLDKFDGLLVEILNENPDKKIVVFIDDLDRVTPTVAKETLDNLRTFFDKKKISFVVTGDHTVLERFLGKELLPDADSICEQQEEGRRFMKKIFNIYWRLPQPVEGELDDFLGNLFKQRQTRLKKIFNAEEGEKFKGFLKNYFERNFRNIIRFLDYCVFTFDIIDSADNHEDLLSNPLLVIRILMIQELCAPLFEAILHDHNLLARLEYAVDKKDADTIRGILDSIDLTPSQKSFINDFIYQEDRFYKNSSLVVSDLIPFLYLASDSGAPDLKGPSPEDFISILARGNSDEISQILVTSGDKRTMEAANKVVEIISNTEETAKNVYILPLVKSLAIIAKENKAQEIFFEEFSKVDLSYTNGLNSSTKFDTYISFTKWFDHIEKEDGLDRYFSVFANIYSESLDNFALDTFNYNSTIFYLKWFREEFARDKVRALQNFENIYENNKLDLIAIRNEIVDFEEDLLNFIVNEPATALKEFAFKLLKELSPNGDSRLNSTIKESIKQLSEQAWVAGLECLSMENTSLTRRELEGAIVSLVRETPEDKPLGSVLNYARNKIEDSLVTFWEAIVKKELEELVTLLPDIISDSSFVGIAPDSISAEYIFKKILAVLKTKPDEQKLQWLDYLESSKWLWFNLDKIDARTFSLTKSHVGDISERSKQILLGWKAKQENSRFN